MKILLIEEDEILIANLTKHLTEYHYIVDVVKDSETAWSYGSTFEYDLFIFDITSPNINGINLCHRFRFEGYAMPILLITENSSKDKVNGLDAGADDCVVKPFDMPELIARVRALLRRSNASSFPLLVWGDLLLNPITCEVFYHSQPLTLTNKEYELLELLLRDSQHLLSADEILDRLWSSDDFPSEATVRSHIRHLRHKLVSAGAPSDFVATVHGRGYYLKAPDKVPNLAIEKTSQSEISNSPNLSSINFSLSPQESAANPSLSFTINQPQVMIKLMIVDDDVDYLRSLPNLLAPWEFKVTTLDDPQQFWSVLQAVLPEVLVLDVNIPPFDGLELCQTLRSYPQWQRLPVLFLSSVSDTDTQNLAFSVGADDYLCKPIASIDLANRIRSRLQRISAAIADLSPLYPDFALPPSYHKGLSNLPVINFEQPRELPQWGDIFSEFCLFVRPVGDREEADFLERVRAVLTLHCQLAVATRPFTTSKEISKILSGHRYYCQKQQQNDKTRRVLEKSFGTEWTERYMTTMLFDSP